ncbi:MAG: DUF3800 domain-containing protein [Pseudomonadota bacterium]
MYLLYLDDSGSVGNATDRHVILAGLAVHERRVHWLSKEMDALAKKYWPDSNNIEFRGTDIRGGKKHWRGLAKAQRVEAYSDALRILARSAPDGVRLFGVAVHKASCAPSAEKPSPEDPMEYAFEQCLSRFDYFLTRLHRKNDTQRGLIILDKSSYETSLQGLARDFAIDGHRWGNLHNVAEVPLFVDSKATRMIQFADLIAHALRLYFEIGDDTYFDIIKDRFDHVGGQVHGLMHRRPVSESCACFYCRQRPI